MSNTLHLKRGLTLNIVGAVNSDAVTAVTASSVAVTADDFIGLTPKVDVKEGDVVSVGQPLFHDKYDNDIAVVSPVSGTVSAVVRGERRKLIRIIITPSSQQTVIDGADGADISSAEALRLAIKRSGVWAMMRQRPYDIVPDGASVPRDIFVTLFDLAPLAPDADVVLDGRKKLLEAGVKALSGLTGGNVYVCRGDSDRIGDIEGAVNYVVSGPYPASNVGVQIDHIAPVNKGDIVWTLDATALLMLGSLVTTGSPDYSSVVAVTGSAVDTPCYVKVPMGTAVSDIISGNIKNTGHHLRYISGNVLTGVNVGAEGYLQRPYTQITVIPEGDDVDEFMGWASISPRKQSVSRTFPGKLFGRKLFNPDARILGGRRAMIMSGEYERVTPMDIMPEYLIKAIMSRDIDRMEALGIYEIAPEDFAAAEYVDTSKLPLQQIVREGLDYLRRELN